MDMNSLAARYQIIIAAILTMLLVVTRGYHFSSINNLPSASWAVFMLAGFYLRPAWAMPAFLAVAASLDFAAVTWGGVPNFCVSPAYWMLAPAYGSLWLAGRWYATQYRFSALTFLPLLSAVLVGSFVCELFSSGGFYMFSGRFANPNLAEFGARLVKYFPAYLQSVVFYIGLTVVVHCIFVMLTRKNTVANAV